VGAVPRVAEYLITGAGGQLGTALVQTAPGTSVGVSHQEMDVSDAVAVNRVVSGVRPALVVHAGAWTDVDGCEADPAKAWRINAEGTANVARACAGVGAHLIYISTDYVFAGDGTRPYEPADAVRPLSAYGASKLGGELGVRLLLPQTHTIVRTSWVFSSRGRNFVRTILRLAATQSELRVVKDQRGRPTRADDLAEWIWALADRHATGTFHACNAGECTWYEFAKAILDLAGSATPVVPVTTSEFSRPAPRPAYSVLSTEALTEITDIEPRPWSQALSEVLGEPDH